MLGAVTISNGTELWKSNGTSTGTTLVSNINTGAASAYPGNLTNVAGALYFSATNGNGYELWRSNGTTTSLIEIEAGSDSNPWTLYAIDDRLYFTAERSDTGQELYTLREDSIVPVITNIASNSPNGTYSTGQSINITLTFSEAVTLSGGNLNLSLDTGAVVSITPFSGMTASATYIIGAAQTSPDLNVSGIALAVGATVLDAGSNNANLALPVSNLAVNANLIINPIPPTVTNISVNQGANQRSRLTTIALTFDQPVNATNFTTLGAIQLQRTKATFTGSVGTLVQTGATGSSGRILVSPDSGTTTLLTLTFDNADGAPILPGVGYGSLTDGRWQLSIPSIGYSSAFNDPILRRLFGDSNNDGLVDASDYAMFGNSFGQSSIDAAYDFDSDGTVDASDFAQFGNRFGITL